MAPLAATNPGPGSASTLHGHVDFGAPVATAGYRRPFTTQATMSDVANAATVTLIDQATGKSLATTLTDANGNFNLNLSGFSPATSSYYLEAFKGLNNNAAASSSVRVRTVIQFVNGGWESMTNTIPNAGITLDVGTTALSVITSLRQATTNPVNLAYLNGISNEIGTINPALVPAAFQNPGVGAPSSTLNISQTEYTTVYGLVEQALQSNLDPLYNIVYNASNQTYALVGLGALPTATALGVTSGGVGATVTITGTGFAPNSANDQVFFYGGLTSQGTVRAPVQATVTAASATSLTCTVPSGALSGQVTIAVDSLYLVVPGSFSVLPTPSTFAPASSQTGNSITIGGTGFDWTAANDTVYFTAVGGAQTVAGTVTAASYSSLTVTVPAGAITGPVKVTTPGGSGTSASNFVVIPWINGPQNTAAGAPGTSLTINGTGFEATQGTSTVTFNGTAVTVTSWSDTAITVTVPAAVGVYSVVVTVAGNASNTDTFDVWNWTDGGKSLFDPAGNMYFGPWSMTVYKVAAGTTTVSTLASTLYYPVSYAMGPDGYLYCGCYGKVQRINVSTGAVSDTYVDPANYGYEYLAFTPTGDLMVSNVYTYYVHRVNIKTWTDKNAYYISQQPRALVCDSTGNTYVQTYYNTPDQEISAGGVVSSIGATQANYGSGIAIDPSNTIYELRSGPQIIKWNLATPTATSSVSSNANLYVTDWSDLSYHDTNSLLYTDQYWSTKSGTTTTYYYNLSTVTTAGVISSWLDVSSYGDYEYF